MSLEEALNKINELEHELESLKEEYEDYKNQVEENYKPISVAEQVGYNEKDYI